jgi:hypothetical protein
MALPNSRVAAPSHRPLPLPLTPSVPACPLPVPSLSPLCPLPYPTRSARQYAETFAWVGVSPADVATARASTVEAQASLVATLGGSNFMKGDGLSTTRTGTKAVAAVAPAALTVSAITAGGCMRVCVCWRGVCCVSAGWCVAFYWVFSTGRVCVCDSVFV